MNPTRLFLLTLLAMIAFAGNSLLCRLALKETVIDAASFTFVRIFSGAVALWLITRIRKGLMTRGTVFLSADGLSQDRAGSAGNWISALTLFVYAAAFSFAYISLSAGTGALLLFGAVQATMIVWGLHKGEQLHLLQLGGLALALAGLVVLLLPGLSAPHLSGSVLMMAAGVSWGIYSLRGRSERNPADATTGNFMRAVPFAAILSLAFFPRTNIDRSGAAYAVASGAIASGLGYVIWYIALFDLRAASAATVQLSVPVLAAAGGIILLGEPLTPRYLFASIAVLGGIALVVMNPFQQPSPDHRGSR